MRQQKIVYYDPLQMDGKEFLAAVLNWLRHEAIDKRRLSLAELSTRAWVLEEAREDQPQQLTNTTECAVFHCITADCIADDIPVTSTLYTLSDIDDYSYRRKLGCDILRGSFHMYPTSFA
jgi:Ulp1 family protease